MLDQTIKIIMKIQANSSYIYWLCMHLRTIFNKSLLRTAARYAQKLINDGLKIKTFKYYLTPLTIFQH